MKSLKYFRKKGKAVLLRVDYNVDFDKRGKIIDDFRITKTIPTIKYLLGLNSKIIIATHIGRPKFPFSDLSTSRLLPYLERKLKRKIIFLKNFLAIKEKSVIEKLPKKSIVLLENLRFHKEEEENNANFARKLAELASVFVFDAFSVAHRKHSSVVSLPKFLESYYGFLFEKEIEALEKAISLSQRPLALVLGGAKEETKFPLIKYWLNKADSIILGGVIANNFLKARGFRIGESLYTPKFVSEAKKIMEARIKAKITLPRDTVLLSHQRRRNSALTEIGPKDTIQDIGKETIPFYKKSILGNKTVVFNGPMGYIEDKRFQKGTLEIAKSIIESGAFSVVGGGETLMFLKKSGLRNKFSFVSTGGGAMLEFLSGRKLPIFKFINSK